MHKVMTRAQHRRPGSRPPNRPDSRRPGDTPRPTPPQTRPAGTPPRGPGATRTTSAASRPPRPSAAPSAHTRPRDNRPSTASAPVRRAASRPLPADVLFAERLLAVLSGQRPVHSMLRHTAGRAYDELSRLAERGPLRTRGAHPVLRAIGYFEPRPGAVEVFARIGAGDQLRAMAFRLERGRDLRWRCTAVELGAAVRSPHGEGG
ncbi:Rv3235 family protein [Streptomyces fumanus]|uniref:Rv3235 family protein n=1 Tax=Streptomyces fumanus TaxID=67302 RepID=UPI0033F28550